MGPAGGIELRRDRRSVGVDLEHGMQGGALRIERGDAGGVMRLELAHGGAVRVEIGAHLLDAQRVGPVAWRGSVRCAAVHAKDQESAAA